MRYCSASAVRILTLLTLVVLSSHSFVLVNAAGSGSPTDAAAISTTSSPVVSSPAVSSSPSPPSPSSTPAVSSSPTPSPSPSSSPAQSNSPSAASSSPPASPSQQSTSASTNAASSGSASAAAPSSAPQDTSSSTSSGAPTSTSASDSGSSSASSSGVSSGSSSTQSARAGTLTVSPASGASALAGQQYSNYPAPSDTSVSIEMPNSTGSATATNTAAEASTTPTSFLQNKGAMAGVFTVVAVIGLAIVAYIAFKVMKRRARLRDEEDDVFFEKYSENEPPMTNLGPSDSSYNVATTAAAADAYPDRMTHYGPTGAEAYENPQQYGMEYPPGTAYAAAQNGGQYQYTGQNGPYDAAGGYAPSSNGQGHPFADPNHVRAGTAPRVAYPNDAYYGNAPGAGQTR